MKNYFLYFNRPFVFRILKFFLLGFVLVAIIFLSWEPRLIDDVTFSRAVFDRNGKLLRLTLSQDEKYRLYMPLSDIPDEFKNAVLLSEDQYFYTHIGVNPVAILRAAVQTYITGPRTMGASTITMQLARLKYKIHTRNIFGKIWQVARAVQIELHYTKDEILEAYLNLAPYGYNIEGIGAASYIYFQKRPNELTLPESMALAVIPQNPTKRCPRREDPSPAVLLSARQRLFDRWIEEYPDQAHLKPFFSLPLATYTTQNLPFRVPHLVMHLLAKNKDRDQIHATIDLSIQTQLEKILTHFVIDHHDIGIENASALLVDNQTRQIVASMGSADFWNKKISGQVDGTRAKRSPGSTLKPFIYALAFDQGVIHPYTILADAPLSRGVFSPDNFDFDFRGPITARDALRYSRNIPAIKLAGDIQKPDLYEFLKQAGVSRIHATNDYGLSLVLGGAEVTMRELATFYMMLARDGKFSEILDHIERIDEVSNPKPSSELRLLTSEAAFITLDILRDTPRSFMRENELPVYWKTGTSNGFHDAWTAGIFGHYTLVVWVGHFNGQNNPAFIGLRSAAPLFFNMIDVIDGIEPQRDLVIEKAPKLNLRRVDVCATTGDLSLRHCPARAQAWFIPGVSPIRSQNIYQDVLVDMRTGKRACGDDHKSQTILKTFEVWPSDLAQALRAGGITKPSVPMVDANCKSDFRAGSIAVSGTIPTITSPQPHVRYHTSHDGDITGAAMSRPENAEAIPLTATAGGDSQILHWFINDTYFGKSNPEQSLFWNPVPGEYAVRVVDDHGRSNTTHMVVLYAPSF